MKRVLGALCVLTCLLGGYGVACAIPIEFSDFVWEPTLLSAGETTTWEHNIKDDGFVPATDVVESASLTLFLSDDLWDLNCDSWPWTYELEYGSLHVGGQSYYLGEIDFGLYVVELTAFIQLQESELQESGALQVRLISDGGDFYFGGSWLQASVERAAPVPEPQTMLLFGCGLIGLAGFGRKRLLGRL